MWKEMKMWWSCDAMCSKQISMGWLLAFNCDVSMHLQFLSKHEAMHVQMPHLNFPSFPSHNKLTHCTAFVQPTLVNRSCVSNASPKRSLCSIMFNNVQSPFFCGSIRAPQTHCYFLTNFIQLYRFATHIWRVLLAYGGFLKWVYFKIMGFNMCQN